MSAHTPEDSAPLAGISRVLADAQRRWGERALRVGPALRHAPGVLQTGHAALDQLVGGGLPRAALSEILGAPTSGAATVALGALAGAQHAGALGAWVDLGETFDAEYAAACGASLDALLVVRPRDADDALGLLPALAQRREIGALVVDGLAWVQAGAGGPAQLQRCLQLVGRALAESGGVMVALTPLPYPPAVVGAIALRGSLLAQAAALRVAMLHGPWDVGDPARPLQRAQALVLKRRGAEPGASAEVPLRFAGPGGAP